MLSKSTPLGVVGDQVAEAAARRLPSPVSGALFASSLAWPFPFPAASSPPRQHETWSLLPRGAVAVALWGALVVARLPVGNGVGLARLLPARGHRLASGRLPLPLHTPHVPAARATLRLPPPLVPLRLGGPHAPWESACVWHAGSHGLLAHLAPLLASFYVLKQGLLSRLVLPAALVLLRVVPHALRVGLGAAGIPAQSAPHFLSVLGLRPHPQL